METGLDKKGSERTLGDEYNDWLQTHDFRSTQKLITDLDYDDMIEHTDNKNSVFMSVIIRTQGRRPEGLQESLLCLYSQACQDFEVVLIGHKLNPEQSKLVDSIVDEQPPTLRKKIRYFELQKGNRTVPLNFGFAHARGQYAIIYDDDDIVFEDWIGNFKEVAQSHPGSVIHTFSLKQFWSSNMTPYGVAGLRAESAPTTQYCKPFDYNFELIGNNCPPLSLAFPMGPFRNLGIRFDESLDCLEDWDYLMQIVSVAGIVDHESVSSIYRWWTNAESSQTVCSSQMWEDNTKKIRSKLNGNRFFIYPSNVSHYSPAPEPAKTEAPPEPQEKANEEKPEVQDNTEETSISLDNASITDLVKTLTIRFFGEDSRIFRAGKKVYHYLRDRFLLSECNNQNSRNNNFNVVRLVAAFFVLAGHACILNGNSPPVIWQHQIQVIGVYLLFIIGGYLIAKSWQHDPYILRYAVKRISRIWPPLVILVLVTVFVVGPIVTSVDLDLYFTHCFEYLKNIVMFPVYALPGVFADNYYQYAVNGSLWTLPVEMSFYILVPAAMVVLGHIRRAHLADAVLISALVLVVAADIFFTQNGSRYVWYGTDWAAGFHLLPFYLMGIAYTREWVKKYLSLPFAAILLAVSLALSFSSYEPYHIVVLIVLPYLVFSFAFTPSVLSKVGRKYEISYGIYLYSFVITQIIVNYLISFGIHVDSIVLILLVFPLSAFAGYLSSRFIENPVRALSKKVLSKIG